MDATDDLTRIQLSELFGSTENRKILPGRPRGLMLHGIVRGTCACSRMWTSSTRCRAVIPSAWATEEFCWKIAALSTLVSPFT